MKYELDSVVIYQGQEVTIWDYSHRHYVYILRQPNGRRIHGVREADLKAAKGERVKVGTMKHPVIKDWPGEITPENIRDHFIPTGKTRGCK